MTFPYGTYCHLTYWLPEFIFLSMSPHENVSSMKEGTWHLLSLLCLQHLTLYSIHSSVGLPRWLSGKESACQCRRCRGPGLDPWVRKIPRGRKWQSPPVFLPGKSHGQRSWAGYSPWGRSVQRNWAHRLYSVNTYQTNDCINVYILKILSALLLRNTSSLLSR